MDSIVVLVCYDLVYSGISTVTIYDNIDKYCKLHGYRLYIDKMEDRDMSRAPQWHKIKSAKKVLETTDCDWVFFMDADCLFMDNTVRLEDLISPEHSIIIQSHSDIPDNHVKNDKGGVGVISSQFFIRNNETGKKFLTEVWDSPDWPKDMDINDFDHEMRQMRISLYKEEYKKHCKICSEGILSSFWYLNNPYMVHYFPNANKNPWEIGKFIAHVTGYPYDEREKLLRDLNDFSGGEMVKWGWVNEEEEILRFTPYRNSEFVRIQISDTSNSNILKFDLKDLDMKLYYILYLNNELKGKDLIVRGYNLNNELKTLKYIPASRKKLL